MPKGRRDIVTKNRNAPTYRLITVNVHNEIIVVTILFLYGRELFAIACVVPFIHLRARRAERTWRTAGVYRTFGYEGVNCSEACWAWIEDQGETLTGIKAHFDRDI
jgi:hypothetical protein